MRRLLMPYYKFEPEMILIPAGEFLMGSDPAQDPHARSEEQPQHRIDLPDYALAKTPVTNAQYAVFLRAARHAPPRHWRWVRWARWARRWALPHRRRHPAVYVTWYDARAYCQWLREITGRPYRLPTEAEWEKAARGVAGQIYPWGNAWNGACCNIQGTSQAKDKDTMPVDAHPQGASPYGLLDMVGNIWEWTSSLWGIDLDPPTYAYPYDPLDGRENPIANHYIRRVLRGVSFYNDRQRARCAARYRYSPRNRFDSVGFRVALSLA